MRAFLFALVLVLPACGSLQHLEPKNTGERIAAAETALTATVEGLNELVTAGVIKPRSPLSRSLGAAIMTARTALDNAHAAFHGDASIQAEESLAIALAAIGSLEDTYRRLKR